MALSDTLTEIINNINFLAARISDLEGLSQDTGSIETGDQFPQDAANNRIFILTSDTTGGPGGTLYRYDSTSSNWLRVS